MNKKLKTTALLLGVCSSLFFANASVSAICKDIDCYHKENPVTQGTGGCTGDGCINVGGKGGKGETLSGLYYQGELSGKNSK